MDKEDLKIRSRSKVLKNCFTTVDKRLDEFKRIEDLLMSREAVQAFKVRLEELEKSHQNFKDRFNAFTVESISSYKLLLLQIEHEFLMDRSSILMAQFDFVLHQREERNNLVAYGEYTDTHIQGLEEAISSTINEIESGVIDKGQYGKNNRLIDLIKKCGEADEGWAEVKAIKNLAVKRGVQLSGLLVDLMIMLSKKDRVARLFQIFRFSLESFEADWNRIIVGKFVKLLKVTDSELIKNKKVLEGSSDDGDDSKAINESQVEQILDKLMSEIFHLELILKDHGVPQSKIPKDQALSIMKARLLKLYEDDHLKAVEVKVNELGARDVDQSLKNVMELKINEVWTQLEEPKEEPQGGQQFEEIALYVEILREIIKDISIELSGKMNPILDEGMQLLANCLKCQDEFSNMAPEDSGSLSQIWGQFLKIKTKVGVRFEVGVFTGKSKPELEQEYRKWITTLHGCHLKLARAYTKFQQLTTAERALMEPELKLFRLLKTECSQQMFKILSEYFNENEEVKWVRGTNIEELDEMMKNIEHVRIAALKEQELESNLGNEELKKRHRDIQKIVKQYLASSAKDVDDDFQHLEKQLQEYNENRELLEEIERLMEEAENRVLAEEIEQLMEERE